MNVSLKSNVTTADIILPGKKEHITLLTVEVVRMNMAVAGYIG